MNREDWLWTSAVSYKLYFEENLVFKSCSGPGLCCFDSLLKTGLYKLEEVLNDTAVEVLTLT